MYLGRDAASEVIDKRLEAVEDRDDAALLIIRWLWYEDTFAATQFGLQAREPLAVGWTMI